MFKVILYIDILKNDVYIKYTTGEIEYVSFTKAEKIISLYLPSTITNACVDNERSVNLINTLLTNYTRQGTKLIRKQT